jgi:hypothetical protein
MTMRATTVADRRKLLLPLALAPFAVGLGCSAKDGCVGLTGAQLVRVVGQPGGGREIAVHVTTRDGVPLEEDLAACLSVRGPGLGETAASKRPAVAAFTLLLV